jgi:hypothetical protein
MKAPLLISPDSGVIWGLWAQHRSRWSSAGCRSLREAAGRQKAQQGTPEISHERAFG